MRKYAILCAIFSCGCTYGFAPPLSRRTKPLPVRSGSSPTSLHVVNQIQQRRLGNRGPSATSSILRGRPYGLLSKLFISPQTAKAIAIKVFQRVAKDLGDIAVISMISFASIPLARFLYRKRHEYARGQETGETMIEIAKDRKFYDMTVANFNKSKTKTVARVLSEGARLAGFIYAVDIAVLLLKELKFDFPNVYPVEQWSVGIVLSIWGARKFSQAKYYMTSRASTRRDANANYSTRIINQAIDVFIYVAAILIMLEFLQIEPGFAVRSVLSLGSVGTLVLSLASRELASEFLASLAIQGTNMFREGDEVILHDGTRGIVQTLGWLHTNIRLGDELIFRVPNTQISTNRIANVSRSRLAQVKQTLAIRYEDIPKMRKLKEDIMANIRESCPTLIDDGFRPFRVNWREYRSFYIEVVVDAHFRQRPSGDAYWELREKVLELISKAVQDNGVKFAYTMFRNGGISISPFDQQ